MRALITDAHDRKSLAATRSLGRRGCQVWVGGSSRWDQTFYSRHCRRRILHPEPASHWGPFRRALLAVAGSGRCDVWLPMSDYTTVLAARHRDELAAHVGLAVPSIEAVKLALDKPRLLDAAERLGLRVPVHICCDTAGRALAAADRVGYPCIIKPREGAGAAGVRLVRNRDEMERLWPETELPPDPVYDGSKRVVEEFVPGEMHAANVLLDSGRPVAAFTQHRQAAVNPLGGLSVRAVSTHEPALSSRALALLRELDWHGPAQVQFILDERDGGPTLLEVNGRFWGSTDLAIQAGVDFPHLASQLALGRHVEPCLRYDVGVAYRWWIPHGILHVLRSGRMAQAAMRLAAQGQDAAAVISELRSTDPFPAAVEALRSAAALLRLPGR